MPEEIKIVVKEERQGTALADAKRDADKLQTSGGAARGTDGRSVAAGADTLKEEATHLGRKVELQKRFNMESAEAGRLAKTTHAAEKASGGHGGSMGGARMVGEMLDMSTGSQGWVMRSMMLQRLPHMIGALAANPMVLGAAVAAAGAAVPLMYAKAHYDEAQKDLTFTNERVATGKAFGRQDSKSRLMGADSGALMQEEMGLRDQAAALRDKKTELEHQQETSVGGIMDSLLGTNFRKKNIFGAKSESQRAIEENDTKAGDLDRQANSKAKEKREEFQRTVVPEIEMSEKVARNDRVGARALEDKLGYLREFQRLTNAGATREEATRGADAKFGEHLHEVGRTWAGAIDARTGAGARQRIADMAGSQISRERGAVNEQRSIEQLRFDVNRNHAEAAGIQAKKDFFTR